MKRTPPEELVRIVKDYATYYLTSPLMQSPVLELCDQHERAVESLSELINENAKLKNKIDALNKAIAELKFYIQTRN
jgi:hypothetical protein